MLTLDLVQLSSGIQKTKKQNYWAFTEGQLRITPTSKPTYTHLFLLTDGGLLSELKCCKIFQIGTEKKNASLYSRWRSRSVMHRDNFYPRLRVSVWTKAFCPLISLPVSFVTLLLVTGQWSAWKQQGWEVEGVPEACAGRVKACWYCWICLWSLVKVRRLRITESHAVMSLIVIFNC